MSGRNKWTAGPWPAKESFTNLYNDARYRLPDSFAGPIRGLPRIGFFETKIGQARSWGRGLPRIGFFETKIGQARSWGPAVQRARA